MINVGNIEYTKLLFGLRDWLVNLQFSITSCLIFLHFVLSPGVVSQFHWNTTLSDAWSYSRYNCWIRIMYDKFDSLIKSFCSIHSKIDSDIMKIWSKGIIQERTTSRQLSILIMFGDTLLTPQSISFRRLSWSLWCLSTIYSLVLGLQEVNIDVNRLYY